MTNTKEIENPKKAKRTKFVVEINLENALILQRTIEDLEKMRRSLCWPHWFYNLIEIFKQENGND